MGRLVSSYILSIFLLENKMAKHTKKVGIVGKYGSRYGSKLRKSAKKIEISQHWKYECEFCGKREVKRTALGIWSCDSCSKTVAGGAYLKETSSFKKVKSDI